MMVLVAREESQRVCEAFRMRGHEAYSADVQEPSGGHPEWHILGDVLPIINGSCEFDTMDGEHHHIYKPWDLLIAHPPCTYLTTAGATRLFDHNHKVIDPEREKKGFEAADFFYKFLQVSLLGTKVCVENPLPLKHFGLPRYSQIIHPYYFGEPWSKRTCLWLVGLPLLIPTNILKSHEPWVNTRGHNGHSGRNPKIRAKTFRGIAKAMAEQWG